MAFLCIDAKAIAAPLILVAYIYRFEPSPRTIDARRCVSRSTSHVHRRGRCRKLLGGRTPIAQSAVRRQSNAGESRGQLGVKLFDRSRRAPVLTKEGVALLAEARAVVSGMDVFKARAKGLSDGLEPELSVVVDVMFPLERLTSAVAAFQEEFPAVPLRLYVEALGAVLQPVMEGRCAFGVMGSLPTAPAHLTLER